MFDAVFGTHCTTGHVTCYHYFCRPDLFYQRHLFQIPTPLPNRPPKGPLGTSNTRVESTVRRTKGKEEGGSDGNNKYEEDLNMMEEICWRQRLIMDTGIHDQLTA